MSQISLNYHRVTFSARCCSRGRVSIGIHAVPSSIRTWADLHDHSSTDGSLYRKQVPRTVSSGELSASSNIVLCLARNTSYSAQKLMWIKSLFYENMYEKKD